MYNIINNELYLLFLFAFLLDNNYLKPCNFESWFVVCGVFCILISNMTTITWSRCPIMFLYVLSPVLWWPLRFPHKNDVRFVFTSGCLWEDSCLVYVICVFTNSDVHHILCCVFVLFFIRSCVPYVASFSGLSIFDLPLRCSLTFI